MVWGRALVNRQGGGTGFVALELCVCVGRVIERGLSCCLGSGGLLSTHPASSCFMHLLYAIGALSDAAMGFAYILSLCGPFKWHKSGSFFCCPNSHWFLQPEVMAVYPLSAATLDCVVWPGVGITRSQGIPPFLPTTCECGTAHSIATATSPCPTASSLPDSASPPSYPSG